VRFSRTGLLSYALSRSRHKGTCGYFRQEGWPALIEPDLFRLCVNLMPHLKCAKHTDIGTSVTSR